MNSGVAADSRREKVTLERLREKRARDEKIVMLTAYDYPSARAIEEVDIDLVLAGDTGAEVALGHPSTFRVSLDEMLQMTAAVRRGLRTPLLIGDLPFGSYEVSDEQAVRTAQRFVKEAGADVVKLERGGTSAARARAIVGAGIPVMGHVGLTPQTEMSLGGRRAQGRTAERALALLADARALEAAGCFAIVIEAMPAQVAEAITARLSVPTIGIGAGAGTSGQVLVWHDLLGIYDWRPRFARAFAELRPAIREGLERYVHEVTTAAFPGEENCYTIEDQELRSFLAAAEADG